MKQIYKGNVSGQVGRRKLRRIFVAQKWGRFEKDPSETCDASELHTCEKSNEF